MIGYYVHHHGAGHAHRFCAVRARLGGDVVGLGSGPRPDDVPADRWVELARDDVGDPNPRDPHAGGVLHWAPLRDDGMQQRTAQLAAWVREVRPRVFVVDVSVEIALAARLLAVPTVVVAQHGVRDDAPHRLAYASASAVAALWNPGQHPAPSGVEAGRLHELGPLSRFDDRIGEAHEHGAPTGEGPPAAGAAGPDGRRRVAVVLGRGGHGLTAGQLDAARESTRDGWRWTVLGDPTLGGHAADGDDVWRALRDADVVIAPASNNCVGEVGAARRPLIAIPQPRPFDEQAAHAAVLERDGLATVLPGWPEDGWPERLDRAARSGGAAWAAHHDGRGAERFAALIRQVAAS